MLVGTIAGARNCRRLGIRRIRYVRSFADGLARFGTHRFARCALRRLRSSRFAFVAAAVAPLAVLAPIAPLGFLASVTASGLLPRFARFAVLAPARTLRFDRALRAASVFGRARVAPVAFGPSLVASPLTLAPRIAARSVIARGRVARTRRTRIAWALGRSRGGGGTGRCFGAACCRWCPEPLQHPL